MNKKDKAYISAFYNGANFGTLNSFFDCFDDNGNFIKENVASPYIKQFLILEFNTLFESYKKIENQDTGNDFYTIENVNNIFNKILKNIVKTFSLKNYQPPQLFIVDVLPKPFSSRPWAAMSVDEKDSKIYNINWGIYFKKSKIRHCYFETLIAHELMHWVITLYTSNDSNELYCPIIEEGICDIMGTYILLNTQSMKKETIYNFYALNRAGYPHNTLVSSYWNSCKIIIMILLYGGIEQLINIIKSGRKKIIEIDINNFNILELSKQNCYSPYLLDIINILIKANSVSTLNIPEYIVYTNTTRRTFSTLDIIQESKLPNNIVIDALKGLNEKGLVFIENDERIFNINDNLSDNFKYYI